MINKIGPFTGGVRKSGITKKHVPLIWESMLGTVNAQNPSAGYYDRGSVQYFDYDYIAARAFAKVEQCTDLRLVRAARAYNLGDDRFIRKGQWVLWGVAPI